MVSQTRDVLHGYRAAGVNRLSFGIQTFNDEALRALGPPPRLRLSPDWGLRLAAFPPLLEARLAARATWQGRCHIDAKAIK